MAARQAESFKSAAFYPFENGALTDLTIQSDVSCGESDITSFVSFHRSGLLYDILNLRRVCSLYSLRCMHITHMIVLGGNKYVTKY